MNKIILTPLTKGISAEKLLAELHSAEGRFAEVVSNFAGSMPFVYLHILWFGFWVFANLGLFRPVTDVFDPFPYGLLTMIVSLEAIFLSTFIMINQNRQALVDTYRELEEEQEQKEEEQEQQELEEEVEDIQKDLDDIKKLITLISEKVTSVEKQRLTKNGNGHTS